MEERKEKKEDRTKARRKRKDRRHRQKGGMRRNGSTAAEVYKRQADVAGYRRAALTNDPQLRLGADLMAQLVVITARQTR